MAVHQHMRPSDKALLPLPPETVLATPFEFQLAVLPDIYEFLCGVPRTVKAL